MWFLRAASPGFKSFYNCTWEATEQSQVKRGRAVGDRCAFCLSRVACCVVTDISWHTMKVRDLSYYDNIWFAGGSPVVGKTRRACRRSSQESRACRRFFCVFQTIGKVVLVARGLGVGLGMRGRTLYGGVSGSRGGPASSPSS